MRSSAFRVRLRAVFLAGLLFSSLRFACAIIPITTPPIDSDRDGLSDQLEQKLLLQFSPNFMIGENDCAGSPAEFRAHVVRPTLIDSSGSIYGQVFPSKAVSGESRTVEIHFYHLWDRDCGAHGHPLDTEHVSVLVRATGNDLETATWKALYWYAAAHENTVCDVSQVSRASTLQAEDRGPKVWISPGKHASYLSETLCHAGCGADRCDKMTPLKTGSIINLGEPETPMNGSVFIASAEWPLKSKMASSNFSAESLARLSQMPASDIAWVNPGKHPAQGIIANSSTVEEAIAESGHNTTDAVSLAGDSTGNALGKSTRNTKNALAKSARNVAHALGMHGNDEKQTKPKTPRSQ